MPEVVKVFDPEDIRNASKELTSWDKTQNPTKEVARYPCTECGKKFTRSGTLRDHERAHNNYRPFKCDSCNKSFTRLKDRKRHQKLHTEEKQFTCRGTHWRSSHEHLWGCGRKFAREDGLVAHFRSATGVDCVKVLRASSWFTTPTILGGYFCGFSGTEHPIGCGAKFFSHFDALEHFDSNVGKTCLAKFAIERAKCFAREIFEKEERRQQQQIGEIGSISIPSNSETPKNSNSSKSFDKVQVLEFSHFKGILMIRLRFPTLQFWQIHHVQFGNVKELLCDFSCFEDFDYTLSIFLPPNPARNVDSESVPVNLIVTEGPDTEFRPETAIAIYLGTYTYDTSPGDSFQRNDANFLDNSQDIERPLMSTTSKFVPCWK